MAQLKDTVVSGSLRATDTLYSTTSQFNILKIPTASGGTTYGVGSNGQIPITNGISVYWGNNISITGNAATATKTGISAIWMYPENSNEINFGGSNTGTAIYFGYRAKDSRAIPTKFVFGGSTGTADLQAKTVYLGSGTSSYVSSSNYTGNAASATMLTSNAGGTEQPIYFTGGKPAATSYYLKANVANGTTNRASYYSADRTLSAAGSIYMTSNNLGINATSITSPKLIAGSSNTQTTMSTAFYVNGNSYLNGTLVLKLNNRAIEFRPDHASYASYIYYGTDGNEALNFVNRNTVTSFIFWTGNRVESASNWYLQDDGSTQRTDNPAMQIKNNSVYINKLIASGTTPEYKFYVNGTSMFVNKIYLGESTTTTAPANAGIYVHDTRNVNHLPNTFGDQTVQWYLDSGTDDTGRKIINSAGWSTIMHLKGWTGSYAAHQLSFNADENNDDGNIYHRSGFNNVWASWDKPTVAGGTVSRVWRLLLDDINISTAETSPFRLTTISKSLTPTQEWADTGIAGANIPMSGSYIVQIYTNANNSAAMAHWHEYYTGIMSWYSDETNSTDADEIVLHKAGHASNGQNLYLRTIRTTTGNGGLKLQIKASKTCTAAGTYVFKFRRVI